MAIEKATIYEYHPFSKDIKIYREILTSTLEHQLVNSLRTYEKNIKEHLSKLKENGKETLTIFFVLEHIYEQSFAFYSDYAYFSLEHCVDEYLYEKKFLGLVKKQTRFTNINFNKFYNELNHKVDLSSLHLIQNIVGALPSITHNLKNYFEGLGLTFELRTHDDYFVVDTSLI